MADLVRFLLASCLLPAACTAAPAVPGDLDVGRWPAGNLAAPIHLHPGDTVEIVFHSAPELNRTAIVSPDGLLRLPYIDPVPAAATSPDVVQMRLEAAYRDQLVDPSLDLLPVSYAPSRVYVGGAVRSPGAFLVERPTDALQALILAGGATQEAHLEAAILMRRNPGGQVQTRRVDLQAALHDPAAADWFALEPYDVLYVPRTRIADHNRFVSQYIRKALPLEFLLVYDVAEATD